MGGELAGVCERAADLVLFFYPLTFGWVGVALFFVLSGFVIHYSQTGRDPNQNVLEFYRRRFWRIYPPYLLALVVFTGLAAMKGAAGPWLAKQFAMHALMVHNLDSKSIYELCPAFWSLAVEMQFYLLYPLVLATFYQDQQYMRKRRWE